MKEQGCTVTYMGHDDGAYATWCRRLEGWVDTCIWFEHDLPALDASAYTLIIGPPAFLNMLKKHALPDQAVACLTSSMQCMMKGICGRCLTCVGPDQYVWACAEQDQPIKSISLKHPHTL
jgi:hypothetical protein